MDRAQTATGWLAALSASWLIPAVVVASLQAQGLTDLSTLNPCTAVAVAGLPAQAEQGGVADLADHHQGHR